MSIPGSGFLGLCIGFKLWIIWFRCFKGSEFGFEGCEFMVSDSGIRVSVLRVEDLGCEIQSWIFRVQVHSGFRVQGPRFAV